MLYAKRGLQTVIVFAIAGALAYAFGFHLLFAHTAFEAVYWGAYYLSTYIVGMFALNSLQVKPKDIVTAGV